jgi:hypothetical protein
VERKSISGDWMSACSQTRTFETFHAAGLPSKTLDPIRSGRDRGFGIKRIARKVGYDVNTAQKIVQIG